MKKTLSILLLGIAPVSALTPLPVHVDLQPVWNVTSATWSWTMRVNGDPGAGGNESGEFRDPLLHFMPVRPQAWEEGGDMLIRPDDSTWDFMGAGAGEPIWFVPQTNNDYTWAGFNNTQGGLFGAYQETDPRVAGEGAQKWLTFRLKQAEGPAGGHVSLYSNYSDGSIILWMATADGIHADDAFFMPAGNHAHTNWAFTRKGMWRVSVSAQGFLGANQADPTPESEPCAFIFAVGNHASWRASHFTSAEVMDDAAAGPAADGDHDGVSNLLEYAFGGDPKQGSHKTETGSALLPRQQIVEAAGQKYLALTYFRRKTETYPEITYSAEWQTGLSGTAWLPGGVETSVTSIDDTWEEVTLRDSISLGQEPKRFGRIKVTGE